MEGFPKSLHTLFIVTFSNGLFCCGIVKERRNSLCCAIKPAAADFIRTHIIGVYQHMSVAYSLYFHKIHANVPEYLIIIMLLIRPHHKNVLVQETNAVKGWLYTIFVCQTLFFRHVIGAPRDLFWPMVKFIVLENHYKSCALCWASQS